MMKKPVSMIIAIAIAFIPASYALAEDTGPGCGVGQMIFPNNNKIIPQILAATTNGTFANQLFGITTGTLGCTNDGIVKNDRKVDVFASVNFQNLKQDMAQGQGEYLSSLATLIGIPDEHQGDFFALTQEKYTSLLKSQDTTSGEMLIAMNQELSVHPTLARVITQ